MNFTKIVLHFILFLFVFQNVHAFDFEGSLTIKRQTCYDTTYYTFTVQQSFVRIDQINSEHHLVQSLILNLFSEKIIALSPDYMLYTDIHKNCADIIGNDFQVIRTNNFKYISGYKCYQHRIRSESMNTEMSYWIYNSDYHFLQKTIQLLSCTDEYSHIFYMFSEVNTKGGLPVLSVERTLLREDRATTIVTQLIPQKVDPLIFKIPETYKFLRY